jgi:hypothetical protein
MASTVTYAYPVAGATAPTAAQAAAVNMITATVYFGATETSGVVTHNWQLTTAQLANLWPVVSIYQLDPPNGATLGPVFTVALTNSVAVTIKKVSGTNQDGTVVVVLMRPHSIIT